MDDEGHSVTFAEMLSALQEDLEILSDFAESYSHAQPQLLMLRAVIRSLAGGRTGPTEQLFNQRWAPSNNQGMQSDAASDV